MNEIQKIAEQAKKALEQIRDGKTFSTNYVLDRLQKAADKNSGDVLICHMRDVVAKRASSQNFITQREIGGLYDDLYGLSGGLSSFRSELEDLLPVRSASFNSEKGAASARIPYEEKLSPLYEDSSLSKELSGVFSLESKATFSPMSDSLVKKAEKFAKLQLISLGAIPSQVRAAKVNEHFVLCNATVNTSDYAQVNIPIPFQFTNGVPSLPQSFVQWYNIVKLNQENLYVFIKDSRNHQKIASRNAFAGQRAFDGVRVESAAIPEPLKEYANLDNDLVAAASKFSRDQVRLATNVVASELASLGVPNPQVLVSSATDRTLTFHANIPHASGQVQASISVDMPNGRPVIPTKFSIGSSSYSMTESGVKVALSAAYASDSITMVSREAEEMGRMSYPQLIDQIDSGVAKEDFKRAEAALSVIQSRFEPEQHLAALDRFSKLLKHATGSSERDSLIKAAVDRGDLISLPTSTQLYCPRLGLPVSKIAFDSKGRMIPRGRVGSDVSGDSGAMISSTKITLT